MWKNESNQCIKSIIALDPNICAVSSRKKQLTVLDDRVKFSGNKNQGTTWNKLAGWSVQLLIYGYTNIFVAWIKRNGYELFNFFVEKNTKLVTMAVWDDMVAQAGSFHLSNQGNLFSLAKRCTGYKGSEF